MPLVIRILRGAYNVYRELYMTRREAGLLEDQRGKTIRAETHIKLLEVENDFLKKARCARKAENAEEILTPSERYQMINQTIR